MFFSVKKRRNLKSQKGATLVEVLVSVAVLGAASFATYQFFSQVSKSKRKDRMRDVQNQIATSIVNSLKSPSHIFYSVSRYDLNPTMASCLLDINAASKGKCSSVLSRSTAKNFALFSVTNMMGTRGTQLTGDELAKKPVYYDNNGDICSRKDNSSCIFEATSKFYVSCDKSKDPSCSKGANQIYFAFKVAQREGSFASLGRKLPDVPKVEKFLPMTVIQVLGPNRNNECGSGTPKLENFNGDGNSFTGEFDGGYFATLVGYDDHGKPKCECIYPFVKIGEEIDPKTNVSVPVCRVLTQDELTCDTSSSNAYLRGYKNNQEDKSAICVSQEDAFDCLNMEPGEICPEGSWITEFVRSECEFTCDYAADKKRTCSFSWLYPLEAGPEDNDDGAFVGFDCYQRDLYCCQPSRFK